ncbi:hypothetical protein [Streptomyces sp. NPDC001530]|uniref:hypothetical protein n=1 Tax=Streptomyces sp. NPDC001530 TaxID=3364582 RepID=UPI00367F3A50
MNKSMKNICGVALAGIFLLGASPAYSLSANTNGAAAWTSECNKTQCKNDDGYVWVKDIKADGHPVKAQYERALSGNVDTLWEKRGNGNSSVSSFVSEGIVALKTCEYINNWPDDCSGWDR